MAQTLKTHSDNHYESWRAEIGSFCDDIRQRLNHLRTQVQHSPELNVSLQSHEVASALSQDASAVFGQTAEPFCDDPQTELEPTLASRKNVVESRSEGVAAETQSVAQTDINPESISVSSKQQDPKSDADAEQSTEDRLRSVRERLEAMMKSVDSDESNPEEGANE